MAHVKSERVNRCPVCSSEGAAGIGTEPFRRAGVLLQPKTGSPIRRARAAAIRAQNRAR